QILDARLERTTALIVHRRQRPRFPLGDLREGPQYVPDRREPVLDIVVHLPREVSGSRAALRFTQACGAATKTDGHRVEQPRERADLIVTIGAETLVELVEIHESRLVGELGQGTR